MIDFAPDIEWVTAKPAPRENRRERVQVYQPSQPWHTHRFGTLLETNDQQMNLVKLDGDLAAGVWLFPDEVLGGVRLYWSDAINDMDAVGVDHNPNVPEFACTSG